MWPVLFVNIPVTENSEDVLWNLVVEFQTLEVPLTLHPATFHRGGELPSGFLCPSEKNLFCFHLPYIWQFPLDLRKAVPVFFEKGQFDTQRAPLQGPAWARSIAVLAWLRLSMVSGGGGPESPGFRWLVCCISSGLTLCVACALHSVTGGCCSLTEAPGSATTVEPRPGKPGDCSLQPQCLFALFMWC